MKAIPNQPLIFQRVPDLDSPLASELRRVVDDPGDAVVFFDTDTMYLQFEREVTPTLVKPDLIDPILAENLVFDGDFDDASQWTNGSEWTVASSQASHSGAGPDYIIASVLVFSGFYILEYEVSGIGVGADITPYLGAVDPGNAGFTRTANGKYTEQIQRTVGFYPGLIFGASGDVTIDNVKLYAVIDGDVGTPVNGWDWALNNWNYQSDGIEHVVGNVSILHFDGLTAGKHYRMFLSFDPGTSGYFSIYEDSTFIEVANHEKDYYYFKATGTEVNLAPSTEFDGKITSVYFQEIDSFDFYYDLFYSSDADATSYDISQFVIYNEDRATLVLDLSALSGEGVLTIQNGCGNIQFRIGEAPDVIVYLSNKFNKKVADDDYSLMVGTADCLAWGFDFANFKLQHRVILNFTNPEYPFTKVSQIKSDGEKDLVYAQRDKVYRVETEHMDEAAHDCISLILACNYLKIDGRNYFWEDKNYNVDWKSNGENFTARSIFKITEKDSVVFNTSASCKARGYALMVLMGFDQYTSYKQLDKFNVGLGDTMTIRLENLEINGVEQLSKIEYLIIRRDFLGNFTPDLNIAAGINGNWSDALAGSTWVQNADEWVNSFILGEEVRFYDAMSIVELIPGTTFKVNISLKYSSFSSSWAQRRYTNAGMARLSVSEIPALNYVS